MESIITTFHIDWEIIVAQAVNFAVVLVVLYLFALKPLNKLMAERSEKIGKGILDAKANAQLLEATKTEYEGALAKARAEANAIFQSGKKEAEEKRVEMLESAKTEVKLMIENGKKTLEAEKMRMVEDAKKEVVALIVAATKKVLDDKAGESSDEKSVNELGKIR
ncbi:MAG: ATP synthase subunit b [Parcubacteria group bacterium GW2011_GWA2_49_9]|nr:MAG: ATP synthase subunit b [Parcubacteria group bacterium GW2011_GWA2_49_9]